LIVPAGHLLSPFQLLWVLQDKSLLLKIVDPERLLLQRQGVKRLTELLQKLYYNMGQ